MKTNQYVIKVVGRINEYVGQISGRKNKKMITVAGTTNALKFTNEHFANRFILGHGLGTSLEIEKLNNPSSFDLFGGIKEFFRGNIDE